MTWMMTSHSEKEIPMKPVAPETIVKVALTVEQINTVFAII